LFNNSSNGCFAAINDDEIIAAYLNYAEPPKFQGYARKSKRSNK
jgi:hypothetical protein